MKLAERLKTKNFRLRVKQHAAVLDYVTAIEDAMRQREISQKALAAMLNKSRAWISKVLRQQPNLTFFTAVEIADALGLDVRVEAVERQTTGVEADTVPFLVPVRLPLAPEPQVQERANVQSVQKGPTFMRAVPNELERTAAFDKAA